MLCWELGVVDLKLFRQKVGLRSVCVCRRVELRRIAVKEFWIMDLKVNKFWGLCI